MAASLETLKHRARIIQSIRSFFIDNGFLEVETPCLVKSPGMEPHLDAFETMFVPEFSQRASQQKLYLPTSPEFHMKRLLGRGCGKIFQITRAFRNGEIGHHHQPEFAILEWYRSDESYESIMDDVGKLFMAISEQTATPGRLSFNGRTFDLQSGWTRLTVREAWCRFAAINLLECRDAARLREEGQRIGVRNLLPDDTWDVLYFKIFLDRIEPFLGLENPLILYEYPAEMSALARLKPTDPSVALRFEIYISGVELGNAFDELTDPVIQRQRCEEARSAQMASGKNPFPIDEAFLHALETGIPPSAGIAMGIDRIVMLFLDKLHIDEVVAFPFSEEPEF